MVRDRCTVFMLAFLCVEREGFLNEMQHLRSSYSSKFIWGVEVSVLSSIISYTVVTEICKCIKYMLDIL
jgi:hypothetical protein